MSAAPLSFFQEQQTFTEKQKAIVLLRETIVHHSQKYYTENDPEISDMDFDQFFSLLKQWENEFPELITSDSPTQKIVHTISEKLEKEKHLVPMISLGNVFSKDELQDWEGRWKKLVSATDISSDPLYIVEPKFDGLGISCVWEHLQFDRAVTRGDGEEGENVTANMKTVPEVLALTVPTSGVFELRGEVVMKKSEFSRINSALAQEDKKQFSNPRNAAAGSLRQLDSSITAQRKLSVFFYEAPLASTNEEMGIQTYDELLSVLEQNNIPHPPQYFMCNTLSEVEEAISQIQQSRNTLDYEIDGAVVKINNYVLREKIGATGHHPRWATAWKFPATQVTTQLEHVEWQVGRTGVLTPVAHLKPVDIDGVTVSRATLHNMDYICEKDICIGDTVFLERSGDVIPKITSVIVQKRNGDEKKIAMPDLCPVCASAVLQKKDEVALRCSNPQCPQVLKGKLKHFASKKAMNITGLGEAVAESLVDGGIINRFSDLYTLSRDDLMKIEGFKDKSITNLLTAIEKSKHQPFWRVINALGIPLIGEKTAKVLASEYPSFALLKSASVENLADIYDVGEKMGKEVVHFFADEYNQEMITSLEHYFSESVSHVSSDKRENTEEVEQIFTDMKLVITGSFTGVSRDEISEEIERRGGKVLSSLSAKTDILLCGEKAGSKKQKALDLGIRILQEDELLPLLFPKDSDMSDVQEKLEEENILKRKTKSNNEEEGMLSLF